MLMYVSSYDVRDDFSHMFTHSNFYHNLRILAIQQVKGDRVTSLYI